MGKGRDVAVIDEDKPQELVIAPGSVPLRNPNHERYCRLRSLLRPKAEAYRAAHYEAATEHTANGNACKLERRQDVQDRIAYLCRDAEEVLREKRKRIEEMLWLIHESNVADLWETVEVDKTDKAGKPVLAANGDVLKKKIQRPKLLSELPEDVQRIVEACSIDEHGRVVPKAYSKLTANQELRKLLGIGVIGPADDDTSRLSDAELIAQLAAQARELGIEIDLSYRFGGD